MDIQEAQKILKECHCEVDSLLQRMRNLEYNNMNSLDSEINKFVSKENVSEVLEDFLINLKKIELINKNKLNKFCLKR